MVQTLRPRLERDGHEIRVTETQLGHSRQWLTPVLETVDAAAVLGGDGAMRMSAPAAVETGTPLHHVPLGTENLLAREFEMRADADAIADTMSQAKVAHMDVGVVNDRLFLLMVSVGLDAEVVADLAARRRSSISHLSYVAPVVRQLARWRPSRVTIEIDGTTVIDRASGMVVVGNCRQYGWRLDPAWKARTDDGLLDVVFLPAGGRLALARWALAARRSRLDRLPHLFYERGQSIRIQSDPPRAFQLDGDAPSPAEGPELQTPLKISVLPAALPLIVPG